MRPGDVVERHHDEGKEEHGGNRANPIPVSSEDSVLVGGRRPAHQLERAQVGGEKAEAGNPGGHLPARHKEIFASIGAAFEVETDGQHQCEIKNDNNYVDWRQMHKPSRNRHSHGWHHLFSFYLLLKSLFGR